MRTVSDLRTAAVVLALLIAAAAHLAAAYDGQQKASTLISCFDIHNCLASERTAWHFLVSDFPSCLVAVRIWWSSKPSSIPVTLVTQLSIARMGQLHAQCTAWRGPLAAAVYIPLVNPGLELTTLNQAKLLDAVSTLDQSFQATENADMGCQLRLLLMYELFNDTKTASLLFPVNSLRNYARLMADTDLIANIDIDLMPSASISTALADPATLAEYTRGCRSGALYVLPAFTTHCNGTDYADSLALGGLEALQEGIFHQCVTIFEHKYPAFHGPTQYDRWFASQNSYRIQYQLLYEPWYLSWRWSTPWFDYRYRGYGYNKCVQAAAMNATGATWLVSPHGFLVHRPHEHTHMRKQFVHVLGLRKTINDLRMTLYGHVSDLWEAAQQDLVTSGRLDVRVEDSFATCLSSLPWWQGQDGAQAGR